MGSLPGRMRFGAGCFVNWKLAEVSFIRAIGKSLDLENITGGFEVRRGYSKSGGWSASAARLSSAKEGSRNLGTPSVEHKPIVDEFWLPSY